MGTLHLPNKKTDIVEEVHERQQQDNLIDEHEQEKFEKIKEKEKERLNEKTEPADIEGPATPSAE